MGELHTRRSPGPYPDTPPAPTAHGSATPHTGSRPATTATPDRNHDRTAAWLARTPTPVPAPRPPTLATVDRAGLSPRSGSMTPASPTIRVVHEQTQTPTSASTLSTSAHTSASLPQSYDTNFLAPPPRYSSRLSRLARLSGPEPLPMATSTRTFSAAPSASPATGGGIYTSAGHPTRFALAETYAYANAPRPFQTLHGGEKRVQQSTTDFVIRTDRSMAREWASAAQKQRQQQHQVGQKNDDASLCNHPRRPSDASHASNAPTFDSTASSGATASTASSFEYARMRSASMSSYSSASSHTTAKSQASMASAMADCIQTVSAARPYTYAHAHTPAHAYTHSATRHHGQFQWQRPAPIKTARKRLPPGQIFTALPGEVLELILDQLKALHLAPGSESCATCWMRDACTMSVTARKMLKYARVALYEDIQLIGMDSAQQRKRFKPLQHGTRLVLLRQTLRSNPQIAAMVRRLKVSALPPGLGNAAVEYENLVASVIMAAPNLERVVGFFPTYSHGAFKRYFQALSTRHRLKENTWIIEPHAPEEPQAQQQAQQRGRLQPSSRPRSKSMVATQRALMHKSRAASPPPRARPSTPPALDAQHGADFFELHVSWQYLTTLTVHCQPGATLTSETLLNDALTCLPALQNLFLSHLPRTAFSDASLLGLPLLKKLSLVHLPGISPAGLAAFTARTNSQSLVSLSLVHVNFDSLQAMARMLSRLTKLTSLSLVQICPPTLTPGEVIWLFPYLASPSLRHLHWDIPTYADRANAADMVMARSIAAGGFPSLRTLRTPADPEGIFQELCRPQETAGLPGDGYGKKSADIQVPARQGHEQTGSTSRFSRSSQHTHTRSGSHNSASHTPPSPSSSELPIAPRTHSNLREARIAAQARIEAARQVPRFVVNVLDADGALAEKYGFGGFVGSVPSAITYLLTPDPGATDDKGGLADMEDMLATGGDSSLDGSDGCTGQWNVNLEMPLKKDRERWWHTERERWAAMSLS